METGWDEKVQCLKILMYFGSLIDRDRPNDIADNRNNYGSDDDDEL